MIPIAADHAGFEMKTFLLKALTEMGFTLKDLGTYSDGSVDYPDYAHQLAKFIADGKGEKGILLCGSANGVAITANKHEGIRAAICWTNEIAQLARLHNNANIICIPARYVSNELAIEMINSFMNTNFEGGRHEKRVNKIDC